MKKVFSLLLALALLTLCACSSGGGNAGNGEFALSRNVEFVVSSKAGGNSDLFSRTISDIIGQNEWINQPIVVNNLEDGNGQVSRHNVSGSKTPDESLLCLSSGDLTVMVTLGGLGIDDFRPIAIMGADKHLVMAGANGRFATMEDAIAAAQNGEQVTIGGTPGDELTVLNMMLEELDLVDKFDFVSFGSSAETVTALLGDHVDLGMGKPAAAKEYVLSGDIVPLVALSTTRFAEPFENAPTLAELGYNDVEFPLYRGVVGAKNMSDEALAYWDNIMQQVSESEEWKDYLDKSLLVDVYKNAAETTEEYKQVEKVALEEAAAS